VRSREKKIVIPAKAGIQRILVMLFAKTKAKNKKRRTGFPPVRE
jgi:hypothetical protein